MKILTTQLASDTAQTTHRARVGMIGLAAVLLLIGLAAAIFATASHDRQVKVIGAANADVVANMVASNATDAARVEREPLAQLGVAPSAAAEPDNATQIDNRAAPAPTP